MAAQIEYFHSGNFYENMRLGDGRSDNQLFGTFLAGDQEALAKLMGFWAPKLFGWLRQRAHNDSQLAEDLVQETFLRVIRSRATFDPNEPCEFKYWLWRVAQNVLWGVLPQKEREQTFSATDIEQFQYIIRTKAGLKGNGHGEEAEEEQVSLDVIWVRWILKMLPPREREILYWVYERNLSDGAATQVMGLSQRSHASSLRRRAKKSVLKWWRVLEEHTTKEEWRVSPVIFYTTAEIARQLGSGDGLVILYIQAGRIKAVKVGQKKWYVKATWLEEYWRRPFTEKLSRPAKNPMTLVA